MNDRHRAYPREGRHDNCVDIDSRAIATVRRAGNGLDGTRADTSKALRSQGRYNIAGAKASDVWARGTSNHPMS